MEQGNYKRNTTERVWYKIIKKQEEIEALRQESLQIKSNGSFKSYSH